MSFKTTVALRWCFGFACGGQGCILCGSLWTQCVFDCGFGRPETRRIGRTQNASPTSFAGRRRIASSRAPARTLLCGGFDACVMLGRVGTTGALAVPSVPLLLTYKYQQTLMCIRLERFATASARAARSFYIEINRTYGQVNNQ